MPQGWGEEDGLMGMVVCKILRKLIAQALPLAYMHLTWSCRMKDMTLRTFRRAEKLRC
jgi:hypothetical protein